MISISNEDDDLCFSKAIITAMHRPIPGVKEAHHKWHSIRKGGKSKMLTKLAKELHQKAGVEEGPVSAADYPKFQEALLPSVRLVVYALRSQDGVIYEGPPADYTAYLFFHHNHYDVIASPKVSLIQFIFAKRV